MMEVEEVFQREVLINRRVQITRQTQWTESRSLPGVKRLLK